MTLGFTTIVNNRPNYFVEKIWQSLFLLKPGNQMSEAYSFYLHKYADTFGKEWDGTNLAEIGVKHHSVRPDRTGRWRAGLSIHFVVNNRTSNRFQFAPTTICTGVQEIEVTTGAAKGIFIDGRKLGPEETELFALNNGVDDASNLANYFKRGYKGTLIHWTGLNY